MIIPAPCAGVFNINLAPKYKVNTEAIIPITESGTMGSVLSVKNDEM